MTRIESRRFANEMFHLSPPKSGCFTALLKGAGGFDQLFSIRHPSAWFYASPKSRAETLARWSRIAAWDSCGLRAWMAAVMRSCSV